MARRLSTGWVQSPRMHPCLHRDLKAREHHDQAATDNRFSASGWQLLPLTMCIRYRTATYMSPSSSTTRAPITVQ